MITPDRKSEIRRFTEKCKNVWTVLTDLLYPPRCAICDDVLGKKEKYCCESCRKRLPVIRGPVCMKCGKPIASREAEYCEDCDRGIHRYDRGIAAFVYTGRMRHSVYLMKHENRRDYLPFYAEEMTNVLGSYLTVWKPDILVPVPMHRLRKRQRGYNQAEILARMISGRTGIPVDPDLVSCSRIHRAQKLLGRKERTKNLFGTFKVNHSICPGKTILLVDDVYTTGSTMDEMSRVLKNAGAEQVYFVVLCTGKGKKNVSSIREI